ncbi:MAG: OmpH/Skp family outer membrane protein [Candidatus Latescibacterota bacterium]
MNRAVKSLVLVMGIVTVVAVLFAVQPCAQQQTQKYAYIRPDYVLSKYDPYNKAMDKVEAFEKAETDRLKKRMDDFQKKVEEAQKQAPLMKEDQIMQKRQELEKEQGNIQKAQDDFFDRQNGQLVKKHAELIQPIINQFNEIMRQYGQKSGYDFIFNADVDNQVILYADPKLDISDEVLVELKKQPAPGTGSSSAIPAPKSPAPGAKPPARK